MKRIQNCLELFMQLIVLTEFANQFPVNFIANRGYISNDNYIGISVYLTIVECFLIVTSQVFLHCPGKEFSPMLRYFKECYPQDPYGGISKYANKPSGST